MSLLRGDSTQVSHSVACAIRAIWWPGIRLSDGWPPDSRQAQSPGLQPAAEDERFHEDAYPRLRSACGSPLAGRTHARHIPTENLWTVIPRGNCRCNKHTAARNFVL